MEAGDPVRHGSERLRRLVPEVVRVGHDAHVAEPGLVQERDGVGDAVDEGDGVALAGSRRLQPEAHPGFSRCLRHLSKPLDDHLACPGGLEVADRSGEADHALRLVRRQPADAHAERVDALGRLAGLVHPGQEDREDGGHRGDAARDPEPDVPQECDVRRIVRGQLHLPDPDAVEAGSGVCRDVLRERGADRRDLGEGELHERPGSLASSLFGRAGFVSSL
jgi:hypothetical protein